MIQTQDVTLAEMAEEDLVKYLDKKVEDTFGELPIYMLLPFKENSEIDIILNRYVDEINVVAFKFISLLNDIPNPTINQIQVIAIDELIRISKKHVWGICFTSDKIYVFNGRYWISISEEKMIQFLTKSIIKMGINNLNARQPKFQKAVFDQFKASANLDKPVRSAHEIKINLKNGTFVVKNGIGELIPFEREDFLTYQLPFDYNPEAEAPLFLKYLNEVIPEEEKQLVLAEFMGYIFIRNGLLKLEKILVLYGSGANGKSVFFEIINSLLGSDNISNHSLEALTKREYDRAGIVDKLVNYSSEISNKIQIDMFKRLASGETITGRHPYGRVFHIENYCRFIFNSNELPKDTEISDAFFRRFIIIHFANTIPEEQQDKKLANKIIDNELSGVFNWMMTGLSRLIKNQNFTESVLISNEVKNYRKNSDTVELFLEEESWQPSYDKTIKLSDLYIQYKSFCKDNEMPPIGNKKLIEALHKRGIHSKKGNEGRVVFISKNLFEIESLSSLSSPSEIESDESDESVA